MKCHLFLNSNVHEALDLILNLISGAIKITDYIYIYIYICIYIEHNS